MKTLMLITALAIGSMSANAGGYRYHGPYLSHYHQHHYGHHHHRGVTFALNYGSYRPYSPVYSSYSYYPAYTYPDYGSSYLYTRPNYAVGGTLLGALAGGLIGHSANHQGWEGAGIGAAAGLVLGSVAERNARARERAAVYYSTAPVSSAPSSYISDAPTVNVAPTVPDAPRIQNAPAPRATHSMSDANRLFGR